MNNRYRQYFKIHEQTYEPEYSNSGHYKRAVKVRAADKMLEIRAIMFRRSWNEHHRK